MTDTPEINYVAKLNIIKDDIRTENRIRNQRWPTFCGFYPEEYRKMNEELRQGRSLPRLPHHLVQHDHDLPPFVPEPKNIRPLPKYSNHTYGRLYGGSPVHPTLKWDKRHKSTSFWLKMGWPQGSTD